MCTYVIGDTHGCYVEFMDLVEKIEQQDPEPYFILVGDIIERGPDTIKMLRWAMEYCNKPNGRFELILGNHEHTNISFLKKYLSSRENGFAHSISDFCSQGHYDPYHFGKILADEHITDEEIERYFLFFQSLPIYKECNITIQGKKQHFIIVHGGLTRNLVNKDETFKKSSLTRKGLFYATSKDGCDTIQKIVWNRWSTTLKRTIIIHGHTPTCGDSYADGRIQFGQKIVNVDCGCVFRSAQYPNANLAALRLEDLQEFYLYAPSSITEENKKAKEQLLKRERKISKKESKSWVKEVENLFEEQEEQ